MVPLIFEMLAKLSRCSNAGAQIFEVLVKVEQSYSNARFLKKAKCSNAVFFFSLSFMYKKAICLGTSSKQVTASPDDLRSPRKFCLYFVLASYFSKANSTHKYILPFPILNDHYAR